MKIWTKDADDIYTAARLISPTFDFRDHHLNYAKLPIKLKRSARPRADDRRDSARRQQVQHQDEAGKGSGAVRSTAGQMASGEGRSGHVVKSPCRHPVASPELIDLFEQSGQLGETVMEQRLHGVPAGTYQRKLGLCRP